MAELTANLDGTTYKALTRRNSADTSFTEGSVFTNSAAPKRSKNHIQSVYVQSNRLSRYGHAVGNLIPFRKDKGRSTELPVNEVGLFSHISCGWIRRYLSSTDQHALPTQAYNDSCAVNGRRLEGMWGDETSTRGQKRSSMGRVLLRFTRTRIICSSIIYILAALTQLLGPVIFLKHLSLSVYTATNQSGNTTVSIPRDSSGSPNSSKTVIDVSPNNATDGRFQFNEDVDNIHLDHLGYIMGLVVTEFVAVLLFSWSNTLNLRTAVRVRSATLTLTYKKMLKSTISNNLSANQFMTLFAIDGDAMFNLFHYGPRMMGGIIGIIFGSLISWILLGVLGLVPIGGILFLYIITIITAKTSNYSVRRSLVFASARISLIEELATNIKYIKAFGYSSLFGKRIEESHRKEINCKTLHKNEGAFIAGIQTIIIIGGLLSAIHAFGSTTPCVYIPLFAIYFFNLRQMASDFCLGVTSIANAQGALLKLKSISILPKSSRATEKPEQRSLAVQITNAEFSWTAHSTNELLTLNRSKLGKDNKSDIIIDHKRDSTFLLKINGLFASKGQLVGVCGLPGSGKTSLLMSILGHLNKVRGNMFIDGKTAYVSTKPWLTDQSVRDNILFGDEFDHQRYYRALTACMLNEDVCVTDDNTPLNNLALTPPQMERIALARAIYASKDIYLLDEPLKSLDVNQSLRIFETMLQTLHDKTIIVVTDKVHFLAKTTFVYVLENSIIAEEGNHEDLLNRHSYRELIQTFNDLNQNTNYGVEHSDLTGSSRDGLSTIKRRSKSARSQFGSTSSRLMLNESIINDEMDGDVEEIYQQTRPWRAFTGSCRGYGSIITLILTLLIFASCVSSNILIFGYTMQKQFFDLDRAVILMSIILLVSCISSGFGHFIINQFSRRTSLHLHSKWLKVLLDAPLKFYQDTILSCILNHFSLGLFALDYNIPHALFNILYWIVYGLTLFTISAMFCYWTIIPILIYIGVSIGLYFYVRRASRVIHSAEIFSREILYSLALRSVDGRATLQAFGKVYEYKKGFYKECDLNGSSIYMLKVTRCYVEYLINIAGVLTLATVGIIMVFTNAQKGPISTGISLIAFLMLSHCVKRVMLNFLDLDVQLLGLKRVLQFVQSIPSENPSDRPIVSLPPEWPVVHTITFTNMTLNSEAGHPAHLKGINFRIEQGEKFGIVGTGRKFIPLVLLRMTELSGGYVYIGDVDVANTPLDSLRQSIIYIPQDPILFEAIKEVLDPSGMIPFDTLQVTLQKVSLWESVKNLPKQLNDCPQNLTAGQRQLLLLAKAWLNRNKIIIIEEALEIGSDAKLALQLCVSTSMFKSTTIVMLVNQTNILSQCNKLVILKEGKISNQNGKKLSSLAHGNTDGLSIAVENNASDLSSLL